MPLVFPASPQGLFVDVLVGLDGQTTVALAGSGRAVTTPILARAEIDTASNVTGVSSHLLRRLGVPVQFRSTTQTASGQVEVDVFEVSISIRNLNDARSSPFVVPQLCVMGLIASLPDADALIGLDVLLGCRLFLDGPNRQFCLDYE